MRTTSNSGQAPTPGNNTSDTQKKSVFDRLGRQLDTGYQSSSPMSMKHRASPIQFTEFMQPPDAYDRASYQAANSMMTDMEWRHGNDGRGRSDMDRHPPGHVGEMHASHLPYDMNRPSPYYPMHPYHNAPSGHPIPMEMHHSQRMSPKYDRHGNPIRASRSGPIPRDYRTIPDISPPHRHMNPMLPIMHNSLLPNSMQDINPSQYGPTSRWPEAMGGQDFGPMGPQMPPMYTHGEKSNQTSRRRRQKAAQQAAQSDQSNQANQGQGSRYTKWRERRNVITNLDRETAQSSSRTNSLKSTLQQQGDSRVRKADDNLNKERTKKRQKEQKTKKVDKPKPVDPQDISDGEIIDDEDSSDDSDVSDDREPSIGSAMRGKDTDYSRQPYSFRPEGSSESYNKFDAINDSSRQSFGPASKKRRLQEGEDYTLDYETISEDEDLDEYINDKKSNCDADDQQMTEKQREQSSEIELLNSLGLDWSHLVEMAKKSKSSTTANTSSGLPRFSLPNYLPTLGISMKFAGPGIYNLVNRICRSQQAL